MLNFQQHQLIKMVYQSVRKALERYHVSLPENMHLAMVSSNADPNRSSIKRAHGKNYSGGVVDDGQQDAYIDIGFVDNDLHRSVVNIVDRAMNAGKPTTNWRITFSGEPHDDNLEDKAFVHNITVAAPDPVSAWNIAAEQQPSKFYVA